MKLVIALKRPTKGEKRAVIENLDDAWKKARENDKDGRLNFFTDVSTKSDIGKIKTDIMKELATDAKERIGIFEWYYTITITCSFLIAVIFVS